MNNENSHPWLLVFLSTLILACFIIMLFVHDPNILLVAISAVLLTLTLFMIKIENILLVIFGSIILFPKINIFEVPGTYVAIRFEDFFLLLVLFVVLIRMLMRGKVLKLPRISIPILIYLSLIFLALFSGIMKETITEPLVGILFSLRKVEYFLVFFLAYFIGEQGSYKKLISLVYLLFIATSVVAFLQVMGLVGGFSLGVYVPDVSFMPISTFGGPYEYAAFLVMLSPIFLLNFMNDKERIINMLMMTSLMSFIIMTQSRISQIALMFGSATMAIISKKTKAMIPMILVFIVLYQCFFSFGYFNRFTDLLDNADPVSNISSVLGAVEYKGNDYYGMNMDLSGPGGLLSLYMRAAKWSYALQGFLLYPVLGMGPSSLSEAVDGNYVRVLGESGIAGFIAFLSLLYILIRDIRSSARNGTADHSFNGFSIIMLGLVVSLSVIAVFIDIFESSKIACVFWLFIGVFYKERYLMKEDVIKGEK